MNTFSFAHKLNFALEDCMLNIKECRNALGSIKSLHSYLYGSAIRINNSKHLKSKNFLKKTTIK